MHLNSSSGNQTYNTKMYVESKAENHDISNTNLISLTNEIFKYGYMKSKTMMMEIHVILNKLVRQALGTVRCPSQKLTLNWFTKPLCTFTFCL